MVVLVNLRDSKEADLVNFLFVSANNSGSLILFFAKNKGAELIKSVSLFENRLILFLFRPIFFESDLCEYENWTSFLFGELGNIF